MACRKRERTASYLKTKFFVLRSAVSTVLGSHSDAAVGVTLLVLYSAVLILKSAKRFLCRSIQGFELGIEYVNTTHRIASKQLTCFNSSLPSFHICDNILPTSPKPSSGFSLATLARLAFAKMRNADGGRAGIPVLAAFFEGLPRRFGRAEGAGDGGGM